MVMTYSHAEFKVSKQSVPSGNKQTDKWTEATALPFALMVGYTSAAYTCVCCHSNETDAQIGTLFQGTQLEDTPEHSPKLH